MFERAGGIFVVEFRRCADLQYSPASMDNKDRGSINQRKFIGFFCCTFYNALGKPPNKVLFLVV